VSNSSLQAQSALGGFFQEYPTVSLREVDDLTLLSVATALDGAEQLQQLLVDTYQISLPVPGFSSESTAHHCRFLGMARDQFFALLGSDFSTRSGSELAQLSNTLGATAYLSEQSDGWVVIRMNGASSRLCLERICSIDLDPQVFQVGAVARTVMEHLGVIVLHEDNDSYLLLSARSSAQSFLDALQVSIKNCL